MKFIFSSLLLVIGLSANGQTTINLSEDLVLTETLEISEDVTYNGNGFKLICEGCNPAIRVTNGARVHFEDVKFVKSYAKWMLVEGGPLGSVTWSSNRMKGYIRRGGE
ncbi:hypothetical protein [Neolewinella persica]|uniref:hypothetical protein n=1 Tax=Neolewinella persica TaxID=70998 RepID=UPI00036201A7|nr:hypothetical protein [Neolewinella persica]